MSMSSLSRHFGKVAFLLTGLMASSPIHAETPPGDSFMMRLKSCPKPHSYTPHSCTYIVDTANSLEACVGIAQSLHWWADRNEPVDAPRVRAGTCSSRNTGKTFSLVWDDKNKKFLHELVLPPTRAEIEQEALEDKIYSETMKSCEAEKKNMGAIVSVASQLVDSTIGPIFSHLAAQFVPYEWGTFMPNCLQLARAEVVKSREDFRKKQGLPATPQ